MLGQSTEIDHDPFLPHPFSSPVITTISSHTTVDKTLKNNVRTIFSFTFRFLVFKHVYFKWFSKVMV
jgi:hypothetical protein